jgi:isocitrate lyase
MMHEQTLPRCDNCADWQTNPRWRASNAPYSAEDVVRLRGTIHIEHSIARSRPRSCGAI